MRGERNNFLTLLKATRIVRVLPSISLIFFSAALMEKLTFDILILGLCSILLYAPGGILNALKDNDFKMPKQSKLLIILFPLLAIIISLHNKILLTAVISAIIVGFIYNVFSRKLVLLDTSILCITHHFIPTFFSLLLLGMNPKSSLFIAAYIYLVFWFLAPIKNLNGIEKDKKLGYKTIPTIYKNGKKITIFFYFISFIMMIPGYFIFELNKIYFLFLTIMMALFLASPKTFNFKNKDSMLGMARLLIAFFGFSLTISLTNNPLIIIPASSIILFYLVALIIYLKKEVKIKI